MIGARRRPPNAPQPGCPPALCAASIAILLCAACSRGSREVGAPAGSGGLFTDVTARSGIGFRLTNGMSPEKHVIEIMLGGLGWIDYDGDGDYDLFFTNYGRNTLYRNEGDGTFVDVTEAAGLGEKGYSTGAAWFDMDRDGDLDLYVVRYILYSPKTSKRCKENGIPIYCNPKFFPGERDLLYENLGDGTFREVGRRAGIETDPEDLGRGLGIAVFDHDSDGHLDVYVANDMNPNFLWHNRGDGTFRDVAQELGVALSAGVRAAGARTASARACT